MDKLIHYVNLVSFLNIFINSFFYLELFKLMLSIQISCGFSDNVSLVWNACRMGVSMPCTQPHRFTLMQSTQLVRHGRSRLKITSRESKFLKIEN